MDDRGIERVGAWVASGAGGVGALAGSALVARWAVRETGLVWHPELGFALGLLLGAAGLVAAEVSWGRSQRALAAGLGGTGLGVVYLTIYAGHAWLGLLGAVATSALLLAATAVGVLQAVRRDSELMAVLGLVGGMAVPLALGAGPGPSLVYLALLTAAVAAASSFRGWRVLPWLGVGATLVSGLAVLFAAEGPPGLLASVAAASIGSGWALLAAHPRVAPRDGLPWLVGAAGALLAATPLLGRGDDPVAAVLVPLLAVNVQAAAIGAAAERQPGDVGTFARTTAPVLAVLGPLALAGRWAIGDGGTLAAVALVGVATVVAEALTRLLGRPSPVALATRVGGIVGAVVLVSFGAVGSEAAVAAALALCGAWAAVRTPGRTDGAVAAGATLAAALVLSLGEPTIGALATGGLAVVAALAAPVLGRRAGASWWPALATPALLWPLVLAWRGVVGEGLDGVVPLALGLGSAAASLVVRAPTWTADEDGRRAALAALGALTSLFAVVAVPLQLEAQWLTVAWAVEGAALLFVASRTRSAWMAGLALVLLATVTVRLTLNPAVLDYHFVKRAHVASWVWYGYGLPALALALSARVRLPWSGPRVGPTLRAASVAVTFAGANLLVSHGFAGGETLSLLDASDAARVARTLVWAVLGAGLLATPGRLERLFGLLFLCAAGLKLAAWDLWVLELLPGALGLLGVAGCSFVAAGLLGRRGRGAAPVVEST